jgi:hypothetical protein
MWDPAADVQLLNTMYPGEVVLACLQVDAPTWEAVLSLHTDLDGIDLRGLPPGPTGSSLWSWSRRTEGRTSPGR